MFADALKEQTLRMIPRVRGESFACYIYFSLVKGPSRTAYIVFFYLSKRKMTTSWSVFSPMSHLSSPQIFPFARSCCHKSSLKEISYPGPVMWTLGLTLIDIVSNMKH